MPLRQAHNPHASEKTEASGKEKDQHSGGGCADNNEGAHGGAASTDGGMACGDGGEGVEAAAGITLTAPRGQGPRMV